MNEFVVRLRWFTRDGERYDDFAKPVEAEHADAAVLAAKYEWLAILASTDTPDPEGTFDKQFRILSVRRR